MMNQGSTVSFTINSKINVIPIKLIMRVPNPLGLEIIEECPFYEEFCSFISRNDVPVPTLVELRHLRDKIDSYVLTYGLYCDLEHTLPMMYIMM